MELLKQTNYKLFPIIQNVGCFFRSAEAIAELAAKKSLTAEEINTQWLTEKQKGFITNDNCMRASAPIANRALKTLGLTNLKFFEVGIFKNGKSEFYRSIPKRMRRADFLIQKVKTGTNIGTHFRVVDRMGNVIFDPDPRVKVTGIYYSILYCLEEVD